MKRSREDGERAASSRRRTELAVTLPLMFSDTAEAMMPIRMDQEAIIAILDETQQPLYERLISLVDTLHYPVWFEAMKPYLIEVFEAYPYDELACIFLDNVLYLLQLENEGLKYLLSGLPERVERCAVSSMDPEFSEWFPRFAEVQAAQKHQNKLIVQFFNSFESAYLSRFDMSGSVGTRVLRELGISTRFPDPEPGIFFARFSRSIPGGLNHARLRSTIQRNEEQWTFIEQNLRNPPGYVLK